MKLLFSILKRAVFAMGSLSHFKFLFFLIFILYWSIVD